MGSGLKLFLVRHAETEWNAGHIFQGTWINSTPEVWLKHALASRLHRRIQVIYSSDQGSIDAIQQSSGN